jgi:hypothetical protein
MAEAEVSPGPATVAWSPDGGSLAIVRPGGVAILDLSGGTERAVAGPGALSVDWAPAEALLVVERGQDGNRVVSIDPAAGTSRVLHAAPDLLGARWLRAGAGWFAVAAALEVGRIGTRTSRSVTADLGRGPGEIRRLDQILPTRAPLADPSLGWGAVRPNPVHHGLLLPEFRKPPLFPPHQRLIALDPFDPEPGEVGRIDVASVGAEASWSPDGRRAAVVASDGAMHVVEGGRSVPVPVAASMGRHPSWHPTAEVIFLGGWLITPAGAPVRKLVAGGEDAVGVWSPVGDRLAVAAGGRLLVFGDLGLPKAPPADVSRGVTWDALWELGTLRSEGLLASGPYRERRDRLRERNMEKR